MCSPAERIHVDGTAIPLLSQDEYHYRSAMDLMRDDRTFGGPTVGGDFLLLARPGGEHRCRHQARSIRLVRRPSLRHQAGQPLQRLPQRRHLLALYAML